MFALGEREMFTFFPPVLWCENVNISRSPISGCRMQNAGQHKEGDTSQCLLTCEATTLAGSAVRLCGLDPTQTEVPSKLRCALWTLWGHSHQELFLVGKPTGPPHPPQGTLGMQGVDISSHWEEGVQDQ